MKKRRITKKFSLNKETIVDLRREEKSSIMGGDGNDKTLNPDIAGCYTFNTLTQKCCCSTTK